MQDNRANKRPAEDDNRTNVLGQKKKNEEGAVAIARRLDQIEDALLANTDTNYMAVLVPYDDVRTIAAIQLAFDRVEMGGELTMNGERVVRVLVYRGEQAPEEEDDAE